MNEIKWCRDGGQHCWIKLPKGKGLQCYSCPMCEQVIYWSETIMGWVKPGTSSGKPIKGNAQADDPVSDLVVKSDNVNTDVANPPSDPKRKANT